MIKYFCFILLFISYPCFSDENELDKKILIENRMILGSALKIVIPSVKSCVTKKSCYSTGLYNIKIIENNNTATIQFTNTKGDGTYTLNIKKENKDLVIKSEKMVIRNYLDENYKLCFKYDKNGSVVDTLDYSSEDLISESGMTCVKCSLNQTVKECEKNLIKTEKPKVLFNASKYQIKCKTSACHTIRIVDKKKGTTKSLKDEVSEEMFKLSTSEEGDSFKFHEASTDNFKMGRYIRLDYSITDFVSIIEEGREEKHVLENCAIIDLQTAQVKEVASARDEICYIDDYLSEARFTFFKSVPASIGIKTYLFQSPNKPTKMYLVKGDKVTLLDEKTDDSNQKWYFINYKGKKDLNMWIKAEAVDLAPKASEPKPTEKPATKEAIPETKVIPPESVEITKQELDTNPPKNAEVIQAKKADPIKTAKGASSFVLLTSMFGLLSLRLKNIM